jgi:hypothetical protein
MDQIPEDIERMAKFLGWEDPTIRRLLKAYIRSTEMREAITNILKRRCVQAGFDPNDPPTFWPVRDLPPGLLQAGQVRQGSMPGPHFALPEEIIGQHVGIFGHNGTGKSYLAMHLVIQAMKAGLRTWIFDIEDEYSRLTSLLPAGELISLEPEQLRINFFQPPGDWVKPDTWLDEIGLFLRGETFLRDGSLNVFRLGMDKILHNKGIDTGGTDWPSLLEVIEHFQRLPYGPKSRSAGYLESLLNRLRTLATIFDSAAPVSKSNLLETLAKQSVVFRLHRLVGIPLQSLVGFLLLWLARFREASSDQKPHLVIVEESHMLASEEARQDIGENILYRLFRTGRKRGIALMLCDQVPGLLAPAILGNLACRIVMRLADNQSIWMVQNSMGLERRQTQAISTLEPRRAVVQYTLHPTPFEIEVPELSFPAKPQEQQLHDQTREFLSQVQWSIFDDKTGHTSAARQEPMPDDLAGDAFKVMLRICESPAETIDQRCEKLEMDRAREFRARAELDERGFIGQVRQTLGGKVKFFDPLEKGIAWAKKHNIHIKKFKSGIVHEYILSQVEKRIGLLGSAWRLQRNSSIARGQGLQPDLLTMGPDGKRIIVEVACTNLDYDAQNIPDRITNPRSRSTYSRHT